ncbi:hypothetical protein GF389_03695 [Candidatus Dojkabacteria bacterium]|nr:hypothetical protein [Candidatus Dojkabacteria bacterium]
MTKKINIENLPSKYVVEKIKDHLHIFSESDNIHIYTKSIKCGVNLSLGKNIKIQNSTGGPLEELSFGDNVWIDHDCKFLVHSLSIGDYTKINNTFFLYGTNELSIGHNNWIGSGVILDTLGGLELENNVGIGSKSQIYSHAKFGDTSYGCKFLNYKPVKIEEDAWIAPSCTVIMASMATRSMLLAGGTLTKDTQANQIFAGIPAKNITDKTGTQFNEEIDYKTIKNTVGKHLDKFHTKNPELNAKNNLKIVLEKSDIKNTKHSYFVIRERKYTKRLTEVEIAFMKYLLPEKAKFTPF